MCRSIASLAILLALVEPTVTFAQKKESPLHQAVLASDAKAVAQLLEKDADVNALGENGRTPLHYATTPEIVELLLQKKPTLSLREHVYQLTPMQLAAYHFAHAKNNATKESYRKVVDAYLKAGIQSDPICAIYLDDLDALKTRLFKAPKLADDFHDKSLLRIAASVGRTDICKFLLENFKVDVNDFQRGNGFSIMVEAVPYPNIVQLLIKHKADMQTPMPIPGKSNNPGPVRFAQQRLIISNATALHFAALRGSPESITLLLDADGDPFILACSDHPKRKFPTALEVAAIAGRHVTAKAILDHPRFNAVPIKTRVDLLDKCLALVVDPEWYSRDLDPERFKLVQELVSHGANPKATWENKSVLQFAFHGLMQSGREEVDHLQIIAFLRKQGAVFTLIDAVALHDELAVRGLLQFEPDTVSIPRADGDTPLHLAIRQNDKEIVKLLIDANANVHAVNQRKATPLHDACRRNYVSYAELLLQKGAKTDVRDKDNKTPLDLVKNDGYYQPEEMTKLFERYRKK